MENIEFYREHVKINKHQLDEALSMQPSLFLDIAEQTALTRSLADQAKEQLKRVDARAARTIRGSGEKFTEKSIESEILLDKTHKEAFAAYNAAELEAAQWQALKETFSQRGYVLKDLAGLYASGYFQNASVKGSEARIADKMNDERRARIATARERTSLNGS